MASTTPATTPPHPGRKRQPARKPGTPRQNPRPGSQHQSAESGQSQEPPPGEPDIKAYTGPKQARPSEQPSFRITAVTCLYRHCPVTVRESRNHLTNVVLAAEQVVIDPGDVRDRAVNAVRGLLRHHDIIPLSWAGRIKMDVSSLVPCCRQSRRADRRDGSRLHSPEHLLPGARVGRSFALQAMTISLRHDRWLRPTREIRRSVSIREPCFPRIEAYRTGKSGVDLSCWTVSA